MDSLPTDAHCHIEGAASDIDAAVCAICAGQWRLLAGAQNKKIKKVFGLFLGEAINRSEADIDGEIALLKNFLPGADAVGEFGFDKRFAPVLPFFRQEKIFDAHAKFCAEFDLPCVIHCVGAWGFAMKKIRRAVGAGAIKKFLLHSAACPPDMVREFEKLGGYFSFSMRELKSKNGAGAAKAASAERILLESDGAPSAQNYAEALAKAAELRNISAGELSIAVNKNYFDFYSK